MDSVWPSLFSFLALYSLAIFSPGPNFFLVTGKALNHSREEGILTACGVATGSGVFAFAGLVGLLPLVKSLPYFMGFMRFAGGGYLVWVGFDMLRTSRVRFESPEDGDRETSSPYVPYRHGLITNLTNPKAWAFYLSLFTLVMETSFPVWSKVLLNASMFLISLAWYVSVVCLVSSKVFQPIFLNYKALFQGVLGLLVIVAGVKVLWG
jgi:threonine/homoserine/homoserine lactone efflux protein